MQIDPYCQQQKCSPVNVVSSDKGYADIRTGSGDMGVKQESGHLRWRFSYLSRVKTINMQICKYATNLTDVLLYVKCLFTYLLLAIFSESSSQGWNYYILIRSPLLASHLHGNGWPWTPNAGTNRPPIQFVSSYYISTISLHNAVARLP